MTEFKTIKFPNQGTVFDYYIDPESKKFEPWSKKVEKFELDPDLPLQVCILKALIPIIALYAPVNMYPTYPLPPNLLFTAS